jgi:hypothetical protein
VRLDHFEFGLALRAAQDLTFFDLVLVHIHLGGALGTPDHGENLLTRRMHLI